MPCEIRCTDFTLVMSSSNPKHPHGLIDDQLKLINSFLVSNSCVRWCNLYIYDITVHLILLCMYVSNEVIIFSEWNLIKWWFPCRFSSDVSHLSGRCYIQQSLFIYIIITFCTFLSPLPLLSVVNLTKTKIILSYVIVSGFPRHRHLHNPDDCVPLQNDLL